MIEMHLMFARLHDDQVNVHVHNGDYGFYTEWTVRIEKRLDGIEVAVHKHGNYLEEVFLEAFNAYYDTVRKGAPTLVAGLIEGQVADDIPY